MAEVVAVDIRDWAIATTHGGFRKREISYCRLCGIDTPDPMQPTVKILQWWDAGTYEEHADDCPARPPSRDLSPFFSRQGVLDNLSESNAILDAFPNDAKIGCKFDIDLGAITNNEYD